MALAPGTMVGPYEIGASLGAGGMGEVYRARDTKLKREVAVKVLPEIFATDGARKLRFEREAELLASLNHPNIAHLYGLEDAGAVHALVMELVDGATLGERIAQGPIALEEAVVLAKQIAEGLEYAHERAIIHRDLKPANIKVTPDGQTKILDFGLAKAMAEDNAAGDIATSPTISVAATTAGVLLGTAGYMSPEQAKGKSVDRRADIWAFGCVLYEMLTGKPAFDGETITDKLAAVVRSEPELSQLPEKTPERVRELVQRCLIKDPKQRLQAIGEARIALDQWLSHPEEENPVTVGAAPLTKKWIWILGAVAFTTTLLAVTFGWMYRNRAPTAGRVVRAYIKAMPNSSFLVNGNAAGFALSHDGRQLAYVATISEGKSLLWVRPVDSMKARSLEGTDGAGFPFWSPDGRFIGFFAAGRLKKIEASGGPPLTICDAPQGRGGTWNREGVILFTPAPSLPVYRVSAAGGTPVLVTALDQAKHEQSHRWPFFLPDGRHFLYVAGGPLTPKENPTNTVMVGSIDSKDTKPLFPSYTNAIYASGRLLFLRQNTLMAQPFDVQRLELMGDPLPLADPVLADEGRLLGLFSASDNGVLTFVEGMGAGDRQLTWFDRKGTKLGELMGPDAYTDTQISPDGKKVFFTIGAPASDIWTYDLARGVKTRLTFGASTSVANFGSVVSPDGRRMAYTSIRNGIFSIFQRTTDGSGKEDLVVDGSSSPVYPNDWSPDGKLLAYNVNPGAGVYEIWMAPLGDSRKPYPFLQSQFNHVHARFSPDGKFVTYFSTESGRPEVFVVPFPGPGGKWQVSTGGGSWPRWGRDGKEIFYLSLDNRIMSAEVKHGNNGFEIGTVRALFETRPYRTGNSAEFDVSPDSQRFLVTYSLIQANVSIAVVENWDSELRNK